MRVDRRNWRHHVAGAGLRITRQSPPGAASRSAGGSLAAPCNVPDRRSRPSDEVDHARRVTCLAFVVGRRGCFGQTPRGGHNWNHRDLHRGEQELGCRRRRRQARRAWREGVAGEKRRGSTRQRSGEVDGGVWEREFHSTANVVKERVSGRKEFRMGGLLRLGWRRDWQPASTPGQPIGEGHRPVRSAPVPARMGHAIKSYANPTSVPLRP